MLSRNQEETKYWPSWIWVTWATLREPITDLHLVVGNRRSFSRHPKRSWERLFKTSWIWSLRGKSRLHPKASLWMITCLKETLQTWERWFSSRKRLCRLQNPENRLQLPLKAASSGQNQTAHLRSAPRLHWTACLKMEELVWVTISPHWVPCSMMSKIKRVTSFFPSLMKVTHYL